MQKTPQVIHIATSGRREGSATGHGRRISSRWAPWLFVAGLAVVGTLVIAVAAVLLGRAGPLAFRPIPDVRMDERASLGFTPRLVDPASGRAGLEFSLVEAPPGATIDPVTGRFAWTPTERQGPGQYPIRLRAVAADGQTADTAFRITVAEVNRRPQIKPIAPVTVAPGSPAQISVLAEDPDEPARELTFRLLGHAPTEASIDPKTGLFSWTPTRADAGRRRRFTVVVSEATPSGLSAKQTLEINVEGRPTAPAIAASDPPALPDLAVAPPKSEPAVATSAPPDPTSTTASPPKTPPIDANDQRLLDLVLKGAIFQPKSYAILRTVFAKRFARENEMAIRRGLGERREAMERWFADHRAIQEEFYTAIDPAHDDIPGALELFADLVEKYPDRFPAYADLAIALCVVWDMQGRGIYDYMPHQVRAKAILPPGRVGAIDNFQYLLDAEPLMQGRVQYMPWEFLTLVVDHATPLVERRWAVANYLPKRAMFGKCYHDVPYDTIMLDTDSQRARLNGQIYNLANLRQFGGVCAIQADFASRVGKSLGVPAAYVSGESRGGEIHAWVMWVELLGVGPGRIDFSLESYGRYRGDRFYVGKLIDPQINQRITDRQLELRLHTVGLSPRNKRHAALLMKAYPMLRERTKMDVAAQLRFLDRVMQLCPGNQDAWRAVAQMSKDGLLTQRHAQMMMNVLDRLFTTFANFPDFTWEIFDDLVAFEKAPKKRAVLYDQLVTLYVQAKRPDLACAAVLKYAADLVEQERYAEAVAALSSTILAFPDEGRYVPKMLDQLERVCEKVRGAQRQLVDFYQQLLPKIPQMRGSRPSPYCVKMYRRAIDRFTAAGRPDLAAFWQTKLAGLGP